MVPISAMMARMTPEGFVMDMGDFAAVFADLERQGFAHAERLFDESPTVEELRNAVPDVVKHRHEWKRDRKDDYKNGVAWRNLQAQLRKLRQARGIPDEGQAQSQRSAEGQG